jgi:hypothetical protein
MIPSKHYLFKIVIDINILMFEMFPFIYSHERPF